MKRQYDPMPNYMWLVLLLITGVCAFAAYQTNQLVSIPPAPKHIKSTISTSDTLALKSLTDNCNPCTVEVIFSPEFRGGKWNN